jgi:pimeloyl-ACP methyl ester carboxylesterase
MKTGLVDLGGPVHYADFGGSGPPMVLVHGLGGSLANWMAVGGALTERFRVLALDLSGFGRTPPGAGRTAAVPANVALVGRFIDEVAGGPAVVAGNSMGGLIGALLAASRPGLVTRLILVNAALGRAPGAPLDPRVAALFSIYMTPFAGSLFLRWRAATIGPERTVHQTLRLCGVHPSRLPPEVLAAHVAIARDRALMPWADGAFLTAARSIMVLTAWRARLDETLRSIRVPTLIVHGTEDRLVPLATAQHAARLRPDWSLSVLDGVGHTPQLEVPGRWLAAVNGWLDGQVGIGTG